MKKIILKLSTIFLVLFFSCQKEDINKESILPDQFLPQKTYANYPNNQMIVQYKEGLSEIEKQYKRQQYNVIDYKTCTCADPTIELWIFKKDIGQNGQPGIEEKILTAKADSGIEGADINPDIFQNDGIKTSSGSGNINDAFQKIVPSNNNLTIAVIDTGVDYNYFGFNNAFLYNNIDNTNTCNQSERDYFGWDFVNQDNDPFDDYGHGTAVTSIIYNALVNYNLPFQILPVKSFDENGKGSYFDILCGVKYALNNPDIDIINMSFGWYDYDLEILKRIIHYNSQNVLLITSAGNQNSNNDINYHYPSNYTSTANNMLSVAGLSEDLSNIQLAYFSNYGQTTVDIAAESENITFYLDNDNYIPLSGTSYSAAKATVSSGLLFTPGTSPQQLKQSVIEHSVPNNNLHLIKYSSYITF